MTVVGPSNESQIFTLVTQLFADRSPYLAEELAERPHEPITLIVEDLEVFQVLIDCVKYGPQTFQPLAATVGQSLEQNDSKKHKQEAADAFFMKLVHLYLLAAELKDDHTKNMAIDEIIRFSDATGIIPARTPIMWTFSVTLSGDRLRRLMCDFWIYETASDGSGRLYSMAHHEKFFTEVARGLLNVFTPDPGHGRSVKQNWCRDKCRYHEHEHTDRCDDRVNKSQNSGRSSTCQVLYMYALD